MTKITSGKGPTASALHGMGVGDEETREAIKFLRDWGTYKSEALAALIERLSSSLAAERGARDELSFDNSELRTENDALRARLGAARDALGFADETQRGNKHARFNLEGALADLTNSNGNDAVTRRTINRVCEQLAEAERALKDKDDQPHD